MEIKIKKNKNKTIWNNFIYKEQRPFTNKTEINWKFLTILGGVIIVVFIIIVIMIPEKKLIQEVFHEKTQSGSVVTSTENNPTEETADQFQKGNVSIQNVHSSLEHLYAPSDGGLLQKSSGGRDQNSTMILNRNGNDSKIQLSAGTRISMRLTEKIVVSTQALPLIGVVTKDVSHGDDLAIPQGSKILGSISFDDSTERASINLTNIIFPDGRERQLSAIAIGADEQIGIEGNIKSDAIKNTIGQTFTGFIGAYAEGSMKTGEFGSQLGGRGNGIKSAIAKTAEDRASIYAEELKKQKKWIELSYGTQFIAVLNQSFIYKDPGGTNGGR
jgi:type IV secretory pathway VirB10-like protein